MGLRLVIFDLDGTLVDTSGDITDALNHALIPCGLPPMTEKDAIKLVGEGLTKLIEKILGEERKDLKEKALNSFIEYYSSHLVVHSTLYPNVRETLSALRGIKKAVISNKREALSRRLLKELDVLEHFDLIVGSDTAPEKKPSPIPVLYVLDKLGVAAPEAVMVGDSNLDIEAGKKAGIFKSIAVTYGYRDRDTLKEADYFIDDMGELPGLFKEIAA